MEFAYMQTLTPLEFLLYNDKAKELQKKKEESENNIFNEVLNQDN